MHFAEVRDVSKAAREMHVDMLTCRDFGHMWAARTINRYRDYFERVLVCGRCATEAVQRLGRDGTVLDRRYSYAEGYLMKGVGRLDSVGKGALRLAIFDSMASNVIDMEKAKGRQRKKAS